MLTLPHSIRKALPFWQSNTFVRAHQRYECVIMAELEFVDRGYSIEGALRELSLGGALFRNSSQYILERGRERIVVHFQRREISGMIMNVRPEGYGLRFDEPLTMGEMDALSGEYGLTPANSEY